MTPGASLFWSIFLGPIKKVKRGTSATRGLKTRRKKRRGGIHPRVESTQQPLSFRYQSTAEIYSRQVLHTTICHCFVRGPRSKISVPPPPLPPHFRLLSSERIFNRVPDVLPQQPGMRCGAFKRCSARSSSRCEHRSARKHTYVESTTLHTSPYRPCDDTTRIP